MDLLGCMDTLIHYKTLLLGRHRSMKLVDECLDLLSRLRALDPFREGRYQDLSEFHYVTRSMQLKYIIITAQWMIS